MACEFDDETLAKGSAEPGLLLPSKYLQVTVWKKRGQQQSVVLLRVF